MRLKSIMIFKHIRLNNFRQFKGNNIIEFSQPKDGSITLILAENGVGKTTLLQSFRYCFYGNLHNNKYINLSKAEELLNFGVRDELSVGEKGEMFVEVSFEHNDINYIMKRTTSYIKNSSKVSELNTKSTLSKSTKYSGWQTIEGDTADLEMMNILPYGLSHIFMFDGERMERRISDKEFKADLKESVLGILGLKKYDELVKYLGSEGKTTSIIGRTRGLIDSTDSQVMSAENENKKYLKIKEDLDNQIKEEQDKLVEIKQKISNYKEDQKQLIINTNNLKDRERLEFEFIESNRRIADKSKTLLELSTKALLKKEILRVDSSFNTYLSTKDQNVDFYQFLHVNTIDEILERGVCICGERVYKGSPHYHTLESLRKIALPMSNAQYLSYIKSDMLASSTSLNEDKVGLREIKSDLDIEKQNNLDIENKIKKINIEIAENEAQLGQNTQKDLDLLNERSEKIISALGALNLKHSNIEKVLVKQNEKLKPMLEKSEYNRKVYLAVSDLKKLQERIELEKLERETKARAILSRHFDSTLSTVLNGDYKSTISADYTIKIFNNQTNNDETEVLSTGQSVVVSLSFISSLIDTAEELSESMKDDKEYAIIMDAALSNLDEHHTSKVSRYILNTMNQLIFISFKKQIRDEMYNTISQNIGKAYDMGKDSGSVEINEVDLNRLNDFLYSSLEEEDHDVFK